MFVSSSFVATDVFLKSFIIIRPTSHRKWNKIQAGFTESKSGFGFINRMQLYTESRFGFSKYRNLDSLIEYLLNIIFRFSWVYWWFSTNKYSREKDSTMRHSNVSGLLGCSRLICLVLETAALCDIFVRSAVYKSAYLLTYRQLCIQLIPESWQTGYTLVVYGTAWQEPHKEDYKVTASQLHLLHGTKMKTN